MNASAHLHDSGLRNGQLLARLAQAGVVMLDAAQRCTFASDDACELLGAADETALRDNWDSIRRQLPLSDLAVFRAADLPLQRRVDLHTASGTRLLRIEVHAIASEGRARHAMLVRERGCLGRADGVQLMASEAHANRHVLMGLLHDIKGPLNNFQLTLALLTSVLTRMEAPSVSDATRERLARYLDILQNETTRLSECLNDMHALTQPGNAHRRRVDICMVVRDVMRILRHEATLREAALRLDLPPHPAWVCGDEHQLRFAMLGFVSCALDATQPGGVVTLRVENADQEPVVRVDAHGAVPPPKLADDLFRISCTSESLCPAVIAGRMIVEAHAGEVTIECANSHLGFGVRLPGARADDVAVT